MNEINITSAQYYTNDRGSNEGIIASIGGDKIIVPLTEGNRHYDGIMRQVAAGDLTIQDAD